MARQRHLRNAPIREAVIDIRLAPSPEVSIDALRALGGRNSEVFGSAEDIWQVGLGFEFGPKEVKATHSDRQPNGIRLTSKDQKHVVQFRRDGFTFSRLPPYETWENMKAVALSLWGQYAETRNAGMVKRVAVRYINVLPLPMPIQDFADFLTTPPEVPDRLPQILSNFFSRIVLPDSTIGAVAVITRALDNVVEDKAQLIFDIDAFKEVDLPASSPEIWSIFDALRDYKNRIFFESITERTAELFE